MIRSFAALVALTSAVVAAGACQAQYRPTAPPPPLRPEPESTPPPVEQKDCEPSDPQTERRPLSFNERSIPEGKRLADLGSGNLTAWRNPEVPRITREQQLTDAVRAFITALAADPYNVKATYGLAAAYARIGRTQCSINLLTRILQMRPHASRHAEVEQYIDHLLGRRQALDPDFMDMRRDERFRRLIQKMCEGSNDPNCVYGAKAEDSAGGSS